MVLDAIPESERSKELHSINIEMDALPIERTLGLEWNAANDVFKFSINVKDRPPTRRGILSIISSIFDPLGFVAPFILPAKRILQISCQNICWDEDISDEHLIRWRKWISEAVKLEQIKVERCIKKADLGLHVIHEIHHFSDASEVGYGTVSSLGAKNEQETVDCTFLFAKSRLAPLKRVTIPRLELTAAALAVQMDEMLRRELEIDVKDSIFWTDSTSVLK